MNSETPEKYVLLQPPEMAEDDEIDLLELLSVIWKWKWISILIVVVSVVGSVFCALSLPEIYKSEAVIMNTSSGGDNSGGGLARLMGGMGLPINLGGSGGGKGAGIQNFLESRSLKERLIRKYELLPVLFKDMWNAEKKAWDVQEKDDIPTLLDGVEVLNGLFEVNTDIKKGDLTTISWQGEDPEFCRTMVACVLDVLKQYLDQEYITEAKRTRLFVEEQLEKAVREMKFWKKCVPDETMTESDIMMERKVAQQVYEQLRGQLESVKIDEAREQIQFKVLDAPFVPEERFKPNRRMIVVLAFVASVFIAIFLSFLFEFIAKQKKVRQDQQDS